MISPLHLGILVTSACQLDCQECALAGWRKATPGYHMGMEEVNALIDATRKSQYKYDMFLITGGEPFLWRNLVEGLRAFSRSGIVKYIRVFTNAMVMKNINTNGLIRLQEASKYINEIRCSQYVGNAPHVKKMQSLPFMKGKVSIANKESFQVTPAEPVPESLPAQCACDNPELENGKIYVCCGLLMLKHQRKFNVDNSLVSNVGAGYLDGFYDGDKRFRQEACAYCRANQKIVGKFELRKNVI